jgi:hypothetical protein
MHSPDTGGRLPQRKIEDILLAEGKITEEQLEEALDLQETDKRHLGRILSLKMRNLRRSGSGARSAAQRMIMCTYLRFAVFKVIVDCKQL